MDDGDRQRYPLADPQRQIEGALIEIFLETETLDQFGDSRFLPSRRQMEQMRVKFEILPHRQFGIERKRLRHVPDAVARAHIAGSSGFPNSRASPPVGGSKPVSIFIVVVLPEPFEPTEAEDLSPLNGKIHSSTAVKSPKRQVRSRAMMTGSASDDPPRRYLQLGDARAAFLFRQQAMNASSSVAAWSGSSVRPGIRSPDLSGIHRHQPVEPFRFLHIGGRDHHAHARPA